MDRVRLTYLETKLAIQHGMPELGTTRVFTLLTIQDHQKFQRKDSPAWPSISRIARMTRLSPRAVHKSIAWLVENGYLTKTRRKRRNGSDTNSVYHINISAEAAKIGRRLARGIDDPPDELFDFSENGIGGERGSPPPERGSPPLTSNRTSQPEEDSKNPSAKADIHPEPPKEVEFSLKLEPVVARQKSIESAESIYEAYPLKVGRPKAMRAILAAIRDTGIDPEELLQRTRQYATIRKHRKPKEGEAKTCHPTTWFNQHRFNDDPSTWGPEDCVKAATTEPDTEQCKMEHNRQAMAEMRAKQEENARLKAAKTKPKQPNPTS